MVVVVVVRNGVRGGVNGSNFFNFAIVEVRIVLIRYE